MKTKGTGRYWATLFRNALVINADGSRVADVLVCGEKIRQIDAHVECPDAQVVDCSGLLPRKLRRNDTDVLNGIAVKDGRIFLTGKNWPRLYEIRLVEK